MAPQIISRARQAVPCPSSDGCAGLSTGFLGAKGTGTCFPQQSKEGRMAPGSLAPQCRGASPFALAWWAGEESLRLLERR